MNQFIILAMVAIFSYWVYQNNKGKKLKYIFGTLLLWVGVLFIEPFPDPISVGIWAYIQNIALNTINFQNMPELLVNYEIWSILIGAGLMIAGMAIMGYTWKRAWREINGN